MWLGGVCGMVDQCWQHSKQERLMQQAANVELFINHYTVCVLKKIKTTTMPDDLLVRAAVSIYWWNERHLSCGRYAKQTLRRVIMLVGWTSLPLTLGCWRLFNIHIHLCAVHNDPQCPIVAYIVNVIMLRLLNIRFCDVFVGQMIMPILFGILKHETSSSVFVKSKNNISG